MLALPNSEPETPLDTSSQEAACQASLAARLRHRHQLLSALRDLKVASRFLARSGPQETLESAFFCE